MNDPERGQAHLARSLRMLAEIEAATETSPRIETAIMAHWETSRCSAAKANRSRTRRIVRGAATAAAGITILGALVGQRWWPRGADEPARTPEYTTVAVVGGPLMAGEPIRVVRMRVARSVLGELGIPSPNTSHEVRLKPDTTDVRLEPSSTEVRLKPEITEVRLKPDTTEVRLKPDTTIETVDIDVLVGEDGVARGVRVPISEL